MKINIKKVLLCIIALKLLSIICLSPYIYSNLYSAKTEKDQHIIIPKPCSIKCVANILAQNHIIKDKFFFTTYAFISKIIGKKIIAGEYLIPKNTNSDQLFRIIATGAVVIHKITVPEGLTVRQITNLLKTQYGVVDDVKDTTIYKEGELFPSTYEYIYATHTSSLLEKMNKKMKDILQSEWEGRDQKSTQELKAPSQALTLASIIEKEARFDDEKPMIAAVYLNRLKIKMPLQADPTVIYGISSFKDFGRKVTHEDLKTPSPYNTYIHPGLPPTPICVPGKPSIAAALHPQKTDALYFVANAQGRHVFSNNYKQHLKNIAEIKRAEHKKERDK
jgi:UPF0755 protein